MPGWLGFGQGLTNCFSVALPIRPDTDGMKPPPWAPLWSPRKARSRDQGPRPQGLSPTPVYPTALSNAKRCMEGPVEKPVGRSQIAAFRDLHTTKASPQSSFLLAKADSGREEVFDPSARHSNDNTPVCQLQITRFDWFPRCHRAHDDSMNVVDRVARLLITSCQSLTI